METINLEQLSRVTGGTCGDQQQPSQQPQGDGTEQGAPQSAMGSLGGLDQLLSGFQQVLAGFQQLLAGFGGGQSGAPSGPQQPQPDQAASA